MDSYGLSFYNNSEDPRYYQVIALRLYGVNSCLLIHPSYEIMNRGQLGVIWTMVLYGQDKQLKPTVLKKRTCQTLRGWGFSSNGRHLRIGVPYLTINFTNFVYIF